jgi:hypothetical protein
MATPPLDVLPGICGAVTPVIPGAKLNGKAFKGGKKVLNNKPAIVKDAEEVKKKYEQIRLDCDAVFPELPEERLAKYVLSHVFYAQ